MVAPGDSEMVGAKEADICSNNYFDVNGVVHIDDPQITRLFR